MSDAATSSRPSDGQAHGAPAPLLTLGVVATSRKQHELRLPIHPRHLARIAPELRSRIVLEEGYGRRFGVPDGELAREVGGIASREQLFAASDVVVLPKPLHEDVVALRAGQVLWGWPHCVQDAELTQLAIDRRLTLIAWEAMNHWTAAGAFSLHVFHKNNELAGYCSVMHALQLLGRTGNYGPRLRAAVISFGATARGAIAALFALGIHDVTVLTQRSVPAVASPMAPARLVHYDRDADDPQRPLELTNPVSGSVAEFLAGHDIVVNCVLQDTERPLMFLNEQDVSLFARGSLIVDVSCDRGMGFTWARPTSFDEPMFEVGPGVHYYAVDHSPSYLWNSATWEIGEALLPHLPTVMAGPGAWEAEPTIARAIEIRDGVVQNPRILSFQNREPDYPHARRPAAETAAV
jgi:alanine dehydrogenase